MLGDRVDTCEFSLGVINYAFLRCEKRSTCERVQKLTHLGKTDPAEHITLRRIIFWNPRSTVFMDKLFGLRDATE